MTNFCGYSGYVVTKSKKKACSYRFLCVTTESFKWVPWLHHGLQRGYVHDLYL